MKLSTAKVISDILLAMRINRIEDSSAKSQLMKNFLSIRKVVKEADNDRGELAKKFCEDWADERDRPEKSEAYLKAEAEANAAIVDIYENEVELDLEPVPADLLYDPELWGKNDTLGQIANSVDFLAANGVVIIRE